MTKILVVDDEPPVRELLSRWLSAAGYEPIKAEHALAALDTMEREPAAMVLCDVQMPGHDGLWLTMELRRRYPATAVALATGVTNVPPQVSMQVGVLAYLLKPFQRDSVVAAVKQGVEWHEQARAQGLRVEDTEDKLKTWLGTIDAMLDDAS